MHGKTGLYGVATVGAKGQIVIPADAREASGLQPGEKVIVFGRHVRVGDKDVSMLCLAPISTAEQFVAGLTEQAARTEAFIKQAKNELPEASE